MVYLFLGQEQFLKNQTLYKLKVKACGEASSNINYEEFYSGEASLNEMIDSAKTAPFMSKYRLFVLKDINKLDNEDKDALVSFIESKPQSTVLALTADSLPEKDAVRQAVAKSGKILNFDLLEGAKLNKWISDRFSQFNKHIEPQGLQLLVDNTGNNLMQLELAVEILTAFVGKRDVVKQGDVEKIVGKSLEVTTYQLVDAIGAKNADLALRILQGMDKDNRTISQIMGLIGWHLRRIWRAKKMAAAKMPMARAAMAVGVPYYASNSFLRQVGNFSTRELEKGFKTLLKLDKEIKSTPVQAYRSLELLIVQLCG
jgi:DNA polymerase-3 subunit delta